MTQINCNIFQIFISFKHFMVKHRSTPSRVKQKRVDVLKSSQYKSAQYTFCLGLMSTMHYPKMNEFILGKIQNHDNTTFPTQRKKKNGTNKWQNEGRSLTLLSDTLRLQWNKCSGMSICKTTGMVSGKTKLRPVLCSSIKLNFKIVCFIFYTTFALPKWFLFAESFSPSSWG